MKKSLSHRIVKMKRTRMGRLVCRLLGEEQGAVMMEYVIIAVLIAAACVLAVTMFGKTISNQFGVMNRATSGDHTGAKTDQQTSQGAAEAGSKAGSAYHDEMNK